MKRKNVSTVSLSVCDSVRFYTVIVSYFTKDCSIHNFSISLTDISFRPVSNIVLLLCCTHLDQKTQPNYFLFRMSGAW